MSLGVRGKRRSRTGTLCRLASFSYRIQRTIDAYITSKQLLASSIKGSCMINGAVCGMATWPSETNDLMTANDGDLFSFIAYCSQQVFSYFYAKNNLRSQQTRAAAFTGRESKVCGSSKACLCIRTSYGLLYLWHLPNPSLYNA